MGATAAVQQQPPDSFDTSSHTPKIIHTFITANAGFIIFFAVTCGQNLIQKVKNHTKTELYCALISKSTFPCVTNRK